MRKLFRYDGTISRISVTRSPRTGAIASADLVLDDLNDYEKAPIRIEATGGLAKYLCEIESTDAEERYIRSSWYYDNCLFLYRVEIPSTKPNVPAKVIALLDPWEHDISIFGPVEYIETDHPEPITREQIQAWIKHSTKSAEKTGWQ